MAPSALRPLGRSSRLRSEEQGEEADQAGALRRQLGRRIRQAEKEILGRQLEGTRSGFSACEARLEDLHPAADDISVGDIGRRLGFKRVDAQDIARRRPHKKAGNPVAFGERPAGYDAGSRPGLKIQFHGPLFLCRIISACLPQYPPFAEPILVALVWAFPVYFGRGTGVGVICAAKAAGGRRRRGEPKKMNGRLIAVGDIHGCHHEFAELLDTLELREGDRLILLGDLVNRGPDSCKVIDLARERNALSLLGNHELRLLKYRSTGDAKYAKEHDQETFERLRPEDWAYLEAMLLTFTSPN